MVMWGHERLGYEKYHGGRNEEGYRILNFAETHELALVNTFFKKRINHLITYCSRHRTSPVDYLLVRRPDLRRVKNAKVIGSDNATHHGHLPGHRSKTTDAENGVEKVKWWLIDKSKARLEAALNNMVIDLNQPTPVVYEQSIDQIRARARTVLGVTKAGQKIH